jgi:thiol-disulfide isomerase/thioredoxin
MKKISITITALFLFLAATAQTNLALNGCEVQPITVGDKIPDNIWDKYFPVVNNQSGPKSLIRLKDSGNKLIILDFWATYCHPCIESLDYLDSIKAEFKEQIVVVPVLINDRIENAFPFIKKKGYQWPSIVGDTTLARLMLRRYIQGFGLAWIKDGKLLAVPSKKYLTAANIRKVLQGELVNFVHTRGKIK